MFTFGLEQSIRLLADDTNNGHSFLHDLWVGLIAGIVSGFVVAALLWVGRVSLREMIRLTVAANQVPNIEGTWKGTKEKPTYIYTETIELEQRFTKVWGTVDYVVVDRTTGATSSGRQFKFKGTYRANTLAAHYIEVKQDSQSSGSITMQVLSRTLMVGGCTYWEPPESGEERGHMQYDEYDWTLQEPSTAPAKKTPQQPG